MDTAISTPLQTFRDLLTSDKMRMALTEVLPAHMTADRMVKMALVAANRQPELLKCSQTSVMEAIMRSGELGLDCSGTLGEAYLIPFGNHAQFIPGYRGLCKLARQSGDVKRIEAEVVCENDKFVYVKGTAPNLLFAPVIHGERGKARGAYALFEMADSQIQTEWMTRDEIERVRSSSKAPNSLAWKQHWGEMARKTVWRRLAKWAPLSSDKLNRAITASDEEFGARTVTVTAVSGADALAESLATGYPANVEK